jgi:thiamine transport system permease protein
MPGAYIFARVTFRGKGLYNALITVPFVLPTVVVSAAFSVVFGSSSWLNKLFNGGLNLRYSLAGILIAHVFYNYAVVVRLVGSFWTNLDSNVSKAAQVLGASPLRVFLSITLPLLRPALLAAGLLVFIFCFTSFGVILILGGPQFSTLEVAIYRQTITYANLPLASVLSIIQTSFTLVLTLIYTRLQKLITHPIERSPADIVQRSPKKSFEILLIYTHNLAVLLLLGIPLFTLVLRSFEAGLDYYQALFQNPRHSIFYVPPFTAVSNSLKLAFAVTGLSLTLGLLISTALYNQKSGWLLDAIFMLPLGTSAVTMGLGFLVAMGTPPFNIRNSAFMIILAHTLVALPFVVRNILPALQSIQPNLRETASVLGASPWRVFLEVDMPIVWRALAVGAIFAFTVSMGEFGATSMIARPELPTIPTAIVRFLGKPGGMNYGQALAMSTLLMGVCVTAFVFIERLRLPGTQPF